MKILENNFNKTNTERVIENLEKPHRIECDNCESVFEMDREEIVQKGTVGTYGLYNVECPCCGEKTTVDVSIKLDETNIEFPIHFNSFDGGVNLPDFEIQKIIRSTIRFLIENPNESYRYTCCGNAIVICLRDESECDYDNRFTVIVAKNYWDCYVD